MTFSPVGTQTETLKPCNGTSRNTSLNSAGVNAIGWLQLGSLYVANGNSNYYVVGLPQGQYEIIDNRGKRRTLKANKCGILKATHSTSWPASALGAINVSNNANDVYATATFSSLATRNPDICRGSVLYLAS